jgi:hypothetical protein
MVGLIVFFLFILLGIFLTCQFFPFFKKTSYFLPVAYFLGVFFSGTITFLLTFIFLKTSDPLKWATVTFMVLTMPLIWEGRQLLRFKLPSREWALLFLVFFLFSFWLFSRTFQSNGSQILVASNEYLDFGAHIPLIRSFSKGKNFPPELPFYAGKPIFYYFLFDFTTAVLEKAGWPLALSYNLLSALSLTGLLAIIYYFSQEVFKIKSRFLGGLASLLFVLTPDISFIYFFKSITFGSWLTKLRNHNVYLDNGLTVDKFFGGFFNLNVFTNQRHLVFGFGIFAIFVLLLWRIYQKKQSGSLQILLMGVIFGLLPFWHNFVFLAIGLVWGMAFLIIRKKEIFKVLFIGGLIALPQILYLKFQANTQIFFRPGFIMHDQLTLFNLLKFWFYNFGFGLPLMIIGWLTSPSKFKKFFLPLSFLFIVPNIISFAKEPFNDHKFFCLFITFGNFLTAWVLYRLWLKKSWLKTLNTILFFLLIFSGILNLLVLKNDVWVKFSDIGSDSFLTWIDRNTNVRDVFLTNLGIWDPITLTGRKTFLGRPHYIWAYGPNPSDRMTEKQLVLAGLDKSKIDVILSQNKIKYLVFKNDGEEYNREFFEDNLDKIFEKDGWTIYRLAD